MESSKYLYSFMLPLFLALPDPHSTSAPLPPPETPDPRPPTHSTIESVVFLNSGFRDEQPRHETLT